MHKSKFYRSLKFKQFTQKTRSCLCAKMEKIWEVVDISFFSDCQIKLKESEKLGKYLDFMRELKKKFNIEVIYTSIITGILETVLNSLMKTNQKCKEESKSSWPVVLNWFGIFIFIFYLVLWGNKVDLLSFDLLGKPPVTTGRKLSYSNEEY